MLVLTRKPGQRIVINGNITIEVLPRHERGGLAVALGIEAPPEVTVDREEIHLQKKSNPHGK